MAGRLELDEASAIVNDAFVRVDTCPAQRVRVTSCAMGAVPRSLT